jgi:hypothetical protein
MMAGALDRRTFLKSSVALPTMMAVGRQGRSRVIVLGHAGAFLGERVL